MATKLLPVDQRLKADTNFDRSGNVTPAIKAPSGTVGKKDQPTPPALVSAVKAWNEKHGVKFHHNAVGKKKKR